MNSGNHPKQRFLLSPREWIAIVALVIVVTADAIVFAIGGIGVDSITLLVGAIVGAYALVHGVRQRRDR